MTAQATLFGEEAILRLVIPGIPVSGNHKTGWRAVRKTVIKNGQPKTVWVAMAYTTQEGRDFDARVKSIASPIAWRAQWKPAEYACMDVTILNIRQDRDNVNKTIADALEGIGYPHDSRILDGRIVRMKDKRGPRVEVTIRPVNSADYGY